MLLNGFCEKNHRAFRNNHCLDFCTGATKDHPYKSVHLALTHSGLMTHKHMCGQDHHWLRLKLELIFPWHPYQLTNHSEILHRAQLCKISERFCSEEVCVWYFARFVYSMNFEACNFPSHLSLWCGKMIGYQCLSSSMSTLMMSAIIVFPGHK